MKLNLTQIKNLKPDPGKKLLGFMTAMVCFYSLPTKAIKWWRFKFSFGGKEGMQSLGTFPEESLKETRQQADELKSMIRQGIDPAKS